MSPAQYELINAVLTTPGGIVVDTRGDAWNLGAKCTRTYKAAKKRGYIQPADTTDATGQRAVIVTDEGRAAMKRAARRLTTIPAEVKP